MDGTGRMMLGGDELLLKRLRRHINLDWPQQSPESRERDAKTQLHLQSINVNLLDLFRNYIQEVCDKNIFYNCPLKLKKMRRARFSS